MTEQPTEVTDHYPVRDVTSTDDLITVTITCLLDDWTTEHSDVIAQDASDAAADDWNNHAPDRPL